MIGGQATSSHSYTQNDLPLMFLRETLLLHADSLTRCLDQSDVDCCRPCLLERCMEQSRCIGTNSTMQYNVVPMYTRLVDMGWESSSGRVG